MRLTRAAACAAVLVLLTGCAAGTGSASAGDGSTSARTTVTVAAASDLKFALDEISELVARQHPDIALSTTYGSSGQFVQQIRNGAPFDIFLSADRALVEDITADGLADPADTFDYAIGRLVTWYPNKAPAVAGLAGLTEPSIRTVAIANPEHAPYGRAALAALESTGLASDVRPKLVLGENVAQAAEFARTGNADAAIVALSLVLADPVRGMGTWTEVPLDAYPRLDQAGTVLKRAEHPQAARSVREVITSPAGRAILADYGFSLPEGSGG